MWYKSLKVNLKKKGGEKVNEVVEEEDWRVYVD